MTTEEIIQMLTRRPVPPGQICLYKVLYQADGPLTLQEIADQMRESDTQSLNMLLLALANRVAADKRGSWRDILVEIFEIRSEQDLRLRPEMREAIERCPQLLDIIQATPVQSIYEQYGRFPQDESKYLRLEC